MTSHAPMSRSGLLAVVLTLLLSACEAEPPRGRTFPEDQLPDHIKPLTDYGQRGEWSLDGKRIAFLSKAGGDAMEVDVATGEIKSLTAHWSVPDSVGFYRVGFLPNGDYWLTGGPARKRCYLYFMDRSLTKPPVLIPEVVAEGPAVSRTRMKISWTPEQDQIFIADIDYAADPPRLVNKKLIIDNNNVFIGDQKFEGIIEPQNFRPPDDKELTWSQYGHDDRGIFTSETFGYNLDTGALTNYSQAPGQYDEPEGIFPDGEHTLTESDRHHPMGTAFIEVYKLKLDGTASDYVRMTHFSEVEGFRASNPAVSDDGKFFVFQESIANSPAGTGSGLYLFDLEAWAAGQE